MNFIALFIGLITSTYVILRFKKTRLEKTKWAYPLLLGSFPFYYFAFAIYANDTKALGYELLIGLSFIAVAFIAYKSKKTISNLLIGLGCLAHGIYDLFHNHIFINAGTPSWWVEFCGSIDIMLGIYLIYLALFLTRQPVIQNEKNA